MGNSGLHWSGPLTMVARARPSQRIRDGRSRDYASSTACRTQPVNNLGAGGIITAASDVIGGVDGAKRRQCYLAAAGSGHTDDEHLTGGVEDIDVEVGPVDLGDAQRCAQRWMSSRVT